MTDLARNLTRRLLIDSGISPGMRVLDIGCGHGEVTFMIAELVGEHGQVMGIDRDPRPLAAAKERARNFGLTNVTFAEREINQLSPEYSMFDAAVGRRVLMYQLDPVDAVGWLAHALRPGGLIVFQEHDSTIGSVCRAPSPLHERVHRWLWSTVEREGGDIHMGFRLQSVLTQAGLDVEHVRAEAVVLTPNQDHPITAIVRAMIPRIVALGIADENEIDIETLESRLLQERQSADITCIWEMVFGAWAKKGRPH